MFCGPCSPYVEPTGVTKANETLASGNSDEPTNLTTDSTKFATTT